MLDAYQVAVDYAAVLPNNWEKYAAADALSFAQCLEAFAAEETETKKEEEGEDVGVDDLVKFKSFLQQVMQETLPPVELAKKVRDELAHASQSLWTAYFSRPSHHSVLPHDLELVGGGFSKYLVSPLKKVKVELSVETTELTLWGDTALDELQQLALLTRGHSRMSYSRHVAEILGTCAFKEAIHVITESYHTTLSALLHGVCNDSFTVVSSDPVNADSGPLTEEQTVAIFYGICSGLAFLHAKMHVYGLLRPQDVLLGGDNRSMVKLRNLDAKRIVAGGEIEENGMFVFPYRAPETLGQDSNVLLQEDQLHTRAMDVYAAGIILWETTQRGAFPYLMHMDSDAEIMEAIVKKDLRPKFSEDFPVASGIEDIVRRCWRKEPGSRPTASALQKELETNYSLDHSRAMQTVASLLNSSLSGAAAKGLPEAQIDGKTSVSMGAVVERLKLFATKDPLFAGQALISIRRLLQKEEQVKRFEVHDGQIVVADTARVHIKSATVALHFCEILHLRPELFNQSRGAVVELLLILLEEHSSQADLAAALLKALAVLAMALSRDGAEPLLDAQTAAMIVSIFEHDKDMDEAVQVSLLTFLASLAHLPGRTNRKHSSKSLSTEPLDATYINSIVYLMENNQRLYMVGCYALTHICLEKKEQKAKQMTLVKLGAVDKVIKIAAKRRKVEWVQQASLSLLLPLARASHVPVLQRLAKLSAPQYVLKVMSAHRQNLDIIKPCLELLVIFARAKKAKMKLSKESVVREVLETAVGTRENAKMVECCLTVLIALRVQNDVSDEQLLELVKVLPLLAESIVPSTKIQRLTLSVLRSIALAIGEDLLHEPVPKVKNERKRQRRPVVRLSVYGKVILKMIANGLKSGDEKVVRECGAVLKHLADGSDVNKITLLRFKMGTRLLRHSLPFASDPSLTATSSEALMTMGDFNVEMSQKDESQCFNSGVILYALRCIHQYHDNVQIVVFCLQTVGNYVSHFSKCRQEVFMHKGIRLVLLVLNAYMDNSFVAVEALITLRNLCATETAATQLLEGGDVLPTLNKFLNNPPADEKILLHLCELLRQISAGNRRSHITVGARRCVDQGFVSKVLDVMNRCPNSISLQYAGCEVLVNLCSVASWPQHQGRFVGDRVVQVVLALLREGTEIKHVQFIALSTLENMLSHAEPSEEFLKLQEINEVKPVVCSALERNASHGGIAQVALGSLCNLIHHVGTERVCDKEMVELVLRVMKNCEKKVKSGPIVAENGCNIVRAVLGSGDSELKVALLRDGIVEDVCRVMRRFARDTRIQRYCTLALSNLSTAFSDGYWSKSEHRGLVREHFKEEKVVELMDNVTRICQHDEDVQRAVPAIVQFCNESKTWFGFNSSG